MENNQKNTRIDILLSRKNECRSLFKKCFRDPIFSLVPFEIWRDLIVSNADLETITLLSQTCWVFKEIVDNIGENNFNLALMLRKEGQIDLAKKYLFKCAENGNSSALLHVGYAYFYRGWGLEKEDGEAGKWLKKSAECGNCLAMAYYGYFLREYDFSIDNHNELGVIWGQKALASDDPLAVGYCHFRGLGTKIDVSKASLLLESSAMQGNEFAQVEFAFYNLDYGDEENLHAASFPWFLKCAEQGNVEGQYQVGRFYGFGYCMERNNEKAISWFKKAAKQGCSDSKFALMK